MHADGKHPIISPEQGGARAIALAPPFFLRKILVLVTISTHFWGKMVI
jgi:hypothetical protein